MNMSHISWRLMILLVGLFVLFPLSHARAQELNPNPPERPVKLIFIHHSTGENWLKDGYGDLGRTLDANNYFVSDTNYGWGPNGIGDRTDIPNWIEWFGERRSDSVLSALYLESNLNSADITRRLSDPGGENEVILFKSCFPNSNLDGNPNDPPTPGEDWTVGNAKYIYLSLLPYFASQPNRMFIAITAPPVSDPTFAQNARAFNQWLMYEWLADYKGKNVFVFDFYNVLTGIDHHHRFINGKIEHTFREGQNTNAYPSASDDDHPNAEGSKKATEEFVPLLNVYYNLWKSNTQLPQEEIAPSIPQPSQEELEPNGIQQQESLTDEQTDSSLVPAKSSPSFLINNFESGTQGLEHYADESGTKVNCELTSTNVHEGSHSLEINYQLVRDGWLDCGFSFGEPQNWEQSAGISFFLQAEEGDIPVTFYISCGTDKEAATFVTTFQTTREWKKYVLLWNEFTLAPWAEPGTIKNILTSSVLNYGFSLAGDEGKQGKIWIDEVMLVKGDDISTTEENILESPVESPTQSNIQEIVPTQTANKTNKNKAFPCVSGLIPLVLGIWVVIKRNKRMVG